jgi:hypothetical protein
MRKAATRGESPDVSGTHLWLVLMKVHRAAGKVFAGHKTAMDSAAGGLTKSERAMLIQLLEKLGVSAEEYAEPRMLES